MSAISSVIGQIGAAATAQSQPARNDSGQVQGSSAASQLSSAQAAVVTISGSVQKAPSHGEGRKADASFEKQQQSKETPTKKTRPSVNVTA